MRPRSTRSVLLRTVTAALAGTIAGIHLELWSGSGYRHIPTIGPLFVVNGIAGALLALACLALPLRVVRLAWAAIAGYAAATLASVLVSLNGGLFGFVETARAPLLAPSIAAEAAAIVIGAAAAIWPPDARVLSRAPGSGRAGRPFRRPCRGASGAPWWRGRGRRRRAR